MKRSWFSLFLRPAFWKGMATLWPFGNTLHRYHRCATAQEADVQALQGDWQAVGRDLHVAIRKRLRHIQEGGK
jgi:hypothetical protein